jgi:hypothetical protein
MVVDGMLEFSSASVGGLVDSVGLCESGTRVPVGISESVVGDAEIAKVGVCDGSRLVLGVEDGTKEGLGEVVGDPVGSGPINMILASSARVTFSPRLCKSKATVSRLSLINV